MSRKPTDLRSISTRLPEGLRRRLERSAQANDRSMNAEIIHRLTESYTAADTLAAALEGGRKAATASATAIMQVINLTLPEAVRLTGQEMHQLIQKAREEDDKVMLSISSLKVKKAREDDDKVMLGGQSNEKT